LRDRTVNIRRYLISFTHEMTVPADNDTGRHEAVLLGPHIRINNIIYVCWSPY